MTEMISDLKERSILATNIADAINALVKEEYERLPEEPDITSRIGQRLKDMFDGHQIGGHRLKVITQTIPSHGPKSLENPLGTDLYIVFSVQTGDRRLIRKGLLVQAKREERLRSEWTSLKEQCRRMSLVTKKGSVVWLYGDTGVKTLAASDVVGDKLDAVPLVQMLDHVLKCWIGDQRKVPDASLPDKEGIRRMLTSLGAKNGVLLDLTSSS